MRATRLTAFASLLAACVDPGAGKPADTGADGADTTETGGDTASDSGAPDSGADSGSDSGSDSGGDSGSDSGGDSGADTGDTGPTLHAGPRGLLVAQSWDDRALPSGAGAGQYRVLLLQESMYPLLAEFRAANPDAAMLGYQKVGGIKDEGSDHASTGVVYDEADAHESWFLHDAAGNRLQYCDYAGVWAANVGDAGYQAQWLANVRARIARDGFDGVMLDDTNTFPGHCLGSLGTPIAEYATDADYGDAVVAFMAAVGPGLKADGLLVAPNIAMNPWEEVMVRQSVAMLPYVTHWLREYWMRWDDSSNFTGGEWADTLETMRLAQDAGVGYLAITYGPGDEGASEGQRYGRASWLLAWNGASDSSWGYWGDGEDPWSDDWGPDLGLPAEPARRVGVGWVRRYDDGLVVVNPSDDTRATFPLGGTWVDADLGEVDELTLLPGQARILTAP